MDDSSRSPTPLIIGGNDAWTDGPMLAMTLEAILGQGEIKEALENALKDTGREIARWNDLISFLREIFQGNIGFANGTMQESMIDGLNRLARYEAGHRHSALAYDPNSKPNPDAVYWPDPTRETGARSLYDTIPFVEKLGWVNKSTPVGSAGSCFAVEIARYLMKHGYQYVAKEQPFDEEAGVAMLGVEPDEPPQFSCNWGILFNSPSLTQIAEKAFEGRLLPGLLLSLPESRVMDPFREGVVFRDVDAFEADYPRHAESTRQALQECEVFVFTMGLNEYWQHIASGAALSRNPRHPDMLALCRHRVLSVEENVDYIQRFIDIVRAHNPKFKLVLSLSPIPFLATGRADTYHVVTANTHSKAVLRVAADIIAERNDNVVYFPSFEMVTACTERPWAEDQRHVSDETVDRVMTLFEEMLVE